ncbi:MAG: hypothetical protein WB783_04685 [Arenicellales bacterium]
MTVVSFDSCVRRIAAEGLTVRGAFHVEEEDRVPDTEGPAGERTLILIGNAGFSFWPAFVTSPEYRDSEPDPLDRWSERVITQIARELGAHPLFPFRGPPYHPFQRWAQRAESVYPSPLGTLVHPEYGPWHAYRGALVVDRRLEGLPERSDGPSPCVSCVAQPCLHTCPVKAFTAEGFDVGACATHLSGPNDCRDQGCLARNACPAGKPFQYVREQHRFHLAAFLRARQGEGG